MIADSTSALPPLIRLLHRVSASALLLAASTIPAAGQAPDPHDAIRLPPPSYPQAVAEMRAGRPAAALDALDRAARSPGAETPGLEHAILRAALLARAGRPLEAENAWREVIDGAVFMRTFARRALVDSLAGRGAPAEAEPILDTLASADAARHRDLLLRVADAHLDAGTPERAAALYRRVLGVSGRAADADAARLGLAAALEAAGDVPGALDTLREAQLRHRTGDAFVAARRDRPGSPPPAARSSSRSAPTNIGRSCDGCGVAPDTKPRCVCSTSGSPPIPPRRLRTGTLWSA